MKGKIINIEDGAFNDILTIKLDSGNVLESRGFNIGQKGVAMFKIGDVVTVDAVWNDLSKCHYAKNVQLVSNEIPVTLDQVFLLNKKIGSSVYALDTNTGLLVAASLPKRYIREHCLDDMIQDDKLTDRAMRFAKEILN